MSFPKNLKTLSYEELRKILEDHDQRVIFEKTNIIPDSQDLYEVLRKHISYNDIGRKSVLGIDIFKYSSYGVFEQTLIPFLFRTLFKSATRLCLTNHKFIFQNYDEEHFEKNFISTGDGGYIMFDTPLHSLLFAINFAVMLRIYNAYHLYPRLRRIIGGVSMRYAITLDKIYVFENNFYGRGIINCARILSKDDLNRCLIDENVHSWFTINMEGVENLQVITIDDIANIYDFKNYDRSLLASSNDEIFQHDVTRRYGIINADILKIGKISSKETELSIYNLHLQVTLNLTNDDDPSQKKTITFSLGNLNTSGI
ncbi:MAG: hypothetical protein HPY80_11165 [Bacteroidales bacterium]|jgi:hypothetical protein|nr:hypothetical protein [Bacteroidales bacterium]